jgi:hypothetical protein
MFFDFPNDDSLHIIADGLLNYLTELNSWRRTCEQHEDTTVVQQAGDVLHASRRFCWSLKLAMHLWDRAERLPGWEVSMFWEANKAKWGRALAEIAKKEVTGQQTLLLLRPVCWEHQPIVVVGMRRKQTLSLDLILLPTDFALRLHPLRACALLLCCYEHLLTGSGVSPLPLRTR